MYTYFVYAICVHNSSYSYPHMAHWRQMLGYKFTNANKHMQISHAHIQYIYIYIICLLPICSCMVFQTVYLCVLQHVERTYVHDVCSMYITYIYIYIPWHWVSIAGHGFLHPQDLKEAMPMLSPRSASDIFSPPLDGAMVVLLKGMQWINSGSIVGW